MEEEKQQINPITPTGDIMDYSFLKQTGIEAIQNLTGNIWTDYNYHDPGITIMETLAYTLTELGYRSRYNVKDLIYSKEQKKDTLYPPSEILPAQALTIKDFHKLILDKEGIKDVILYPSTEYPEFSGIYDINIELYPDYDDEFNRNIIRQEIFLELNHNRILCEDFNKVKFIEHVPIRFDIDIDINDKSDLSDIYLNILKELNQYLSPSVQFKSLQDMLDEGFTVDEIFEGPLLKSGFIRDSEFERLDSRNEIFASDIIHFIMDVEGVELIKKLEIYDEKGESHKWYHGIDKGLAFKLDVKNTVVRFFKVGKQVYLNEDISQEIDKVLSSEDSRLLFKRLKFIKEQGVDRNLSNYHSIQNDFPEIYGIGNRGLRESSPEPRKAQAKQLKSYLMFFEQILANFYAQLEQLSDLFSIEDIQNTYSSQPIMDIPGIEHLYMPFLKRCIQDNIDITNRKTLKSEWLKHKDIVKEALIFILSTIIEEREIYFDRRNRILDHLLARVAINYSDYRFDFAGGKNNEQRLIDHKIELLKNIVPLSKNRGKAYINLLSDKDEETNISGLENRINSFLELKSNSKKFPFDFFKNQFSSERTNEIKGDETDEEPSFSISFNKAYLANSFNDLFFYGTNINYYQIIDLEREIVEEKTNKDDKNAKNGKKEKINTPKKEKYFKIILLNHEKEKIAEFDKEFLNKKDTQKFIESFILKLTKLSESCESIHIIERILYRPHLEMEYFTFAINYEDGTPAFINKDYMKFFDRKAKIQKIIESGQNPNNYEYTIESNQFKVNIKDDEGEILVTTHKFLNSQEEVNKEIEYFSEFFTRVYENKLDKKDYIRYYTKHYDLFNLSKNPYSFILTILIPEWPRRFQNQSFRTHLENTIKNELPAHILPDIKWVGLGKLIEITSTCDDYLRLLSKRKPDFQKLSNTSDKLFKYFIKT